MVYRAVHRRSSFSGVVLDTYLERGWYRMGSSMFTLSHQFDEQYHNFLPLRWLRYDVESYSRQRKRRSHQELRRKNRDIECSAPIPFGNPAKYEDLYARYLDYVPFHGYPSVQAATQDTLERSTFTTRIIEIKEKDRLIGAGIFDLGSDSVASILHFWAPEERARSLGKLLILRTMEWCIEQGIRWYYPGYITAGNSKMDYKLFLGQNCAQIFIPSSDNPSLDQNGIPGPQGIWTPYHPEHSTPIVYPEEEWLVYFAPLFGAPHELELG